MFMWFLSNVKFIIFNSVKTSKSPLCDCSNAYLPVTVNINVVGEGATNTKRATNEQTLFKFCTPFIDCATEINNTQVDNAKDVDVVILMKNLIEYSDNYSKTSRSLWKYCRDEPDNNMADSKSFKFKSKFLDNTNNEGIINAKVSVH